MKKRTILLVDDEFGPREALRMILSNRYNVLTASDGKTALEKVRQNGDIAVVALDIKLAETDGLSLLKTIKKMKPGVEILMITGFPSNDNAVDALRHGAYDYIVKPFDKEKLKQAIQKGIDRSQQSKLQKSFFSTFMGPLGSQKL